MREMMNRPRKSGSDLRDKHLTRSLMVLAVVAISMYALAVAFLLDQPVGADSTQPAITEAASLESDVAGDTDIGTGSECVDNMIDPIAVLPYAGQSFAYGGFYLAEAVRGLMEGEGGACLQEA